jgi:hypothetical protein
MSDIEAVTNLAADPFTLFAGAILFTAATAFVKELKKPKGKDNDKSRNTESLIYMSDSIIEINSVIKDVVKLLATITAQNNDSDECEETIKRELEDLSSVVNNLVRMHYDENSVFATVKIHGRLDHMFNELNEIRVSLAKL